MGNAAIKLGLAAFAGLMLAPCANAQAVSAQPVAAVSSGQDDGTRQHLDYLNITIFDPSHILPPPPAQGSPAEALEFQRLRALIAAASPERMAQAEWDGAHEDPTAFDKVTGRELEKLPATWALLKTVQDETDVVIEYNKTFFARPRPYTVDPSLPHCGGNKAKKPAKGYPSGHAGFGYSVGWTLAQLIPDKTTAILSRADDYALSREICGVHFHSDTEASHVIGVLAAVLLLNDRRLVPQIAAARAELAAH